jgi:hypothetical protein
VLSVEESTIVSVLNQVVKNHPGISFGSYPFVSHPDFKTVITVEGRITCPDKQEVKEETMPTRNSGVFDRDMLINKSKVDIDEMVHMALDELITTLPPNSVLRVDNDDMTLFT